MNPNHLCVGKIAQKNNRNLLLEWLRVSKAVGIPYWLLCNFQVQSSMLSTLRPKQSVASMGRINNTPLSKLKNAACIRHEVNPEDRIESENENPKIVRLPRKRLISTGEKPHFRKTLLRGYAPSPTGSTIKRSFSTTPAALNFCTELRQILHEPRNQILSRNSALSTITVPALVNEVHGSIIGPLMMVNENIKKSLAVDRRDHLLQSRLAGGKQSQDPLHGWFHPKPRFHSKNGVLYNPEQILNNINKVKVPRGEDSFSNRNSNNLYNMSFDPFKKRNYTFKPYVDSSQEGYKNTDFRRCTFIGNALTLEKPMVPSVAKVNVNKSGAKSSSRGMLTCSIRPPDFHRTPSNTRLAIRKYRKYAPSHNAVESSVKGTRLDYTHYNKKKSLHVKPVSNFDSKTIGLQKGVPVDAHTQPMGTTCSKSSIHERHGLKQERASLEFTNEVKFAKQKDSAVYNQSERATVRSIFAHKGKEDRDKTIRQQAWSVRPSNSTGQQSPALSNSTRSPLGSHSSSKRSL